jgi:hypothetical protein
VDGERGNFARNHDRNVEGVGPGHADFPRDFAVRVDQLLNGKKSLLVETANGAADCAPHCAALTSFTLIFIKDEIAACT